MIIEGKYIDEIIEERKDARENKNWQLSDEYRKYLDTKMAFVFDAKWGQEVYHIPESYFNNHEQSNRQFLESMIKRDIKADKNFEAWLYSIQKSIGLIR